MACNPLKPRISVVLCTYNGARHLEEQLDSLAAQHRLPDELVVGDDGSTDRTLDILERFAARSPFPVRVGRNPERLGSTLNFAATLSRAEGDLVLLCDQDDFWHPAKVERLTARFEADPALDAAFCDARLVDAQGAPLAPSLWRAVRFSGRRRQAFARDPFRVLLQRPAVTGACLAFRRRLRQRFEPVPREWVHDAWIALMAAAWGGAAAIQAHAEALIDYRQHGGNQIGAVRRRRDPLVVRLARVHPTLDREAVQMEQAAHRLASSGAPAAAVGLAAAHARLARARADLGPRHRRAGPVLDGWVRGAYRRGGKGARTALWDLVRPGRPS